MKQRINPTHFENIPVFDDRKKNAVNSVIETPRNQRHKYAFVETFGLFAQKMLLPDGLLWPYDYGFIPRTLADDGDPLDVLFLGSEPTFTGCLVKARVLGVVKLKKNGVENDRIIARPMRQDGLTQDTDGFKDIDDVPPDTMKNICRYLVEYSESEGNTIEFEGTKSRKQAVQAIKAGIKAYENKRH